MTPTPWEFFAEALPYARRAHAATNVPVSVILAQWADETGFGGPDWSPRNNPGNVGDTQAGGQVVYPTLDAGVDAWIRTIKLGYYRAVPMPPAPGPTASAVALGNSPWAAGHYGNPPGSDLLAIMRTYNLTQFDQAQPAPPSEQESETMTSVVLPNGKVLISTAGAGTRADHLLVWTFDPAAEKVDSVIDATDQVQDPNPYLVAP